MASGGMPLFRFDTKLKNQTQLKSKNFCLVGIDEAGRGPLAGPVVASAVVLSPNFFEPNLNDSKKLSPESRIELYRKLKTSARWSIGTAQIPLIDSINILQATHHAMKTALQNLLRLYPGLNPDLIVIDGRSIPATGFRQKSIIKGDTKSAAIASASIIAKVFRDKIMTTLQKCYPQYGLAKNKGYATKEHMKKLLEFGPSPIHRKSFYPVSTFYKRIFK